MRRLVPRIRPLETVDAGPYGSGPDPAWLHEDWSQHLQAFTHRGKRLNYLDYGAGERTLLLVHGWSSGWQHWLEQLIPLRDEFRIIVPDLPGFGASDTPADDHDLSIDGYARALDRLCDHLQVESAVVAGSSMGGFVGAELCIQFATRVEALVLVGAAGLSNRLIGLPTAVLRNPSLEIVTPAVLAGLGAPDAVLRAVVTRRRGREVALGVVCSHPARLHPALVYEIARLAGRPAAAKMVRQLASYDFRERLDDITCPTLVVWGDTDRLVPVSSATKYEEAIAGAEKLLYRDTGHLPMLERPERFNADLRAFLARGHDAGETPSRASA